nr:LysE family translocator [Rhizobium halophytocola]
MLLFAFSTSITPGPNNMMVFASGVNFGFRRTVPHMLGIAIGFMSLLIAVGFGLGAMLKTMPTLYLVLKICGALYLLYIAYKIATSRSLSAGEAGSHPMGFLAAAAFQWVNPKAWVMAVTAMATYGDPVPGRYWLSVLIIGLTFGAMTIPTVSTWAGFGTVLREWLSDPRRLKAFNLLMATLLVISLWPLLT